MEKQAIKAVALISGGLDSMLAAKVIQAQGIHVEGLNFYTGFCHSGHTSAIRKQKKEQNKRNDALWVAEALAIKLHIIDVVEPYKAVLTKPKFGYGQHLNPCLDCKIFMVQKAKEWMLENNFDFIITGEVIGQRLKSQRKATMPIISKCSGADDRLLRPLCARNLPPTLPEKEGWVDREKLFGFSGRSRKPQIELAEQLSIEEFAQPAGGCCVLTDETYSRKLVDLWQSNGTREYEIDDIIMLKVGRHLRPKKHFKLIIGREEGENNFLAGYRKQFTHINILSHTGPLVLIDGENITEEDLQLAAKISARYSDGKLDASVTVQINPIEGISKIMQVSPMPIDAIEKAWYV